MDLVNHSQTFSQSNGSHSPAPSRPDLLANHKRAGAFKAGASLEKKIEGVYENICNPNGVKDEEKAISNFKKLVGLCKEVVARGKECSRLKPIQPKEILRFLKSLPTDLSHEMSSEEEEDFLSIEEALGDYEILPVKASELNRVQLGVLWSQKDVFSPPLFYALISIRLRNLEPHGRKKNKPSLRFLETPDALYKRNPLETCALIHTHLLEECADYKIAMQNFTKRLQGIRDERLERRAEQLKENVLRQPQIPQSDCASKSISDQRSGSCRIIITLVKKEPSLSQEPLDLYALPLPPTRPPSSHSTVVSPISVNPSAPALIDLRPQIIEWMALFLARKEEGTLVKEASIDDLWESGWEMNDLWSIMRASLSKPAPPYDQKREALGEKVVLEISRMSGQSVQKHLDAKIHSSQGDHCMAEECVKKVEKVIKDYKEELEKEKECQLGREELIGVYFKHLTRFVEERVEIKRERIKKKNRFKYQKQKRECAELLSLLDAFHQEVGRVQTFALNHMDQSICIYKKQGLDGSKEREQMDRYDFKCAVKKEKTPGLVGDLCRVVLCMC